MKTSLLLAAGVAAAILAYSSTASADPTPNWSGFYAGAMAGGAFGQSRFAAGGGHLDSDINGVGIGANVGWNGQAGNILFGVEGGGGYAGVSGSFTASNPNLGPLVLKTQINSIEDVRGRVGYATGPWLLYTLGGATFAQADASANGVHASKTLTGWNAGAGAQYALPDGWSVRGEYSYAGFDNISFGSGVSASGDLHRISVGFEKTFR